MTDDLDPVHEAAVEDYMRKAAELELGQITEKQFADWLNASGILTEQQLTWRRSREVTLTEKFENTVSMCADIYGRRIAAPMVLKRFHA